MGTRSLTHVYDRDKILVTIYRQFDGYLTGQGSDIVKAIGGRELVNGISGDSRVVVNGMGCAAALLIAYLKQDMEAGGVSIAVPEASDVWEEFVYTIKGDSMEPHLGISIDVAAYGEVVYSGSLADFDPEDIEDE